MFCPKCGTQNSDEVKACVWCGQVLPTKAELAAAGETAGAAQSKGPGPDAGQAAQESRATRAGQDREGDTQPQRNGAAPSPASSVLSRAGRLPVSTLAVWSFITSIVVCLGPLTSLAAVILGNLARSELKKNPGKLGGAGFATAGLVIGWIITIAWAVLVILAIAGLNIKKLT